MIYLPARVTANISHIGYDWGRSQNQSTKGALLSQNLLNNRYGKLFLGTDSSVEKGKPL
jgi:hypothetical protein